MIVTRRNTYHQVLNSGPNVAESVNIDFSVTSDMPANYVWCKSEAAACGLHAMTASSFGLQPSATRATMKRTSASQTPKAKKTRLDIGPVHLNAVEIAYARIHNKFAQMRHSRTEDMITTVHFGVLKR
jgi:hypothetical protein